jgi:hypothetical protein
MVLNETTDRPLASSVSYLNYIDWRDQDRCFESLAVFRNPINVNMMTMEGPQLITARMVSANFFSTLGISPLAGRDFSPADDHPGAGPTVIISNGAWQRYFGG